MAEKLTPETAGDGRVTEKHNVAPRAAIIQDTYEKYARLNEDIADAIEEYVKPIKEDLKKLMRTAKADTGIDIGVFKAQFKLIDQARQADLDEDENATTIDDIREVFQALKKGGQLNFLEVVDGEGPDGRYAESYNAGRAVGVAGGERKSDHFAGSAEDEAWLAGFDEGAETRLENAQLEQAR